MIVYVITKGEYSGYHICGVTDTLQKAKIAVEFYSDKYYKAKIEKFDTDALNDVFDRGYNAYDCIYYDGDEKVYISLMLNGWEREYLDQTMKRSLRKRGINHVFCYHCCLIAKDEEHAEKIFRDKLAEYKYRREVEEN